MHEPTTAARRTSHARVTLPRTRLAPGPYAAISRPGSGRARSRRPWSRTAMMVGLGAIAALGAARVVKAQDSPPPTPAAARPDAAVPLPWTRVEDARQALSARDGQGTVLVHDGEGWTIVTEPMAATRWTFTPPGHEAHPAVVRRTIQRTPEGRTEVRTDLLCEGPVDACERLRIRFERLDERIRQATRGRHAPAALP